MSAESNVVALKNEYIPPHLRPPSLIVPGEYEMECMSYSIDRRFDRDVLTVWYSMLDYQGEVILPRYYSIGAKKVGSRTQVSGQRHGALVAEFRMLFGGSFRTDRIPVSHFKHVRVFGDVETVNCNFEQKAHPEGAEYSVVRRITRKT